MLSSHLYYIPFHLPLSTIPVTLIFAHCNLLHSPNPSPPPLLSIFHPSISSCLPYHSSSSIHSSLSLYSPPPNPTSLIPLSSLISPSLPLFSTSIIYIPLPLSTPSILNPDDTSCINQSLSLISIRYLPVYPLQINFHTFFSNLSNIPKISTTHNFKI